MRLDEGIGIGLQKIYSSPHFLIFQIRIPQRTTYLYLGRGSSFQCLGIASKNIPPHQRVQDKFLQFAKKNWKGAIWQKIEMDNSDRIVHFSGRKGQNQIQTSFFWRGRDLFFVHVINCSGILNIFRSWLGREEKNGSLPLVTKELFWGLKLELRGGKANTLSKKWYDSYIDENNEVPNLDKRRQKSLLRRRDKIACDLERVGLWKKLSHFARMARDNEFENQMEVFGFRFKFQKDENVFRRRNKLYNKAKSLRKAELLLAQRLKDTDDELAAVLKGEMTIERKTKKIISPIWCQQKNSRNLPKNVPKGVKLFSYKGIKGAMGTNAQSNDWIRIQFANKNDYWFHLAAGNSAHIILKTDQIDMANIELLEVVASCLQGTSLGSYGDIPIIFTQVKNLKGVKGSPGKVLYKKEKHLVLRYQNGWRKRIFLEK